MTDTPREPPGDARRLLVEKLARAVETYAQWCGGVHDDGCPEDNTCDCSYKWVNDGVNDTVRYLREAALSLEAPKLPCTCGPPSFPYQEHEGDCPRGLAEAVPSAPAGLRCMDCSLLYEKFPLDLTLPDEQWRMIHDSDGGVLCASCIVKRAAAISPGVIALRARFEFVADALPKPCNCGADICIQQRTLREGYRCVREAGLAALHGSEDTP